jgi:hypothetical protein
VNPKTSPLHWYDDISARRDDAETRPAKSSGESDATARSDPAPALIAAAKLLDAVKHQLVAAVSANALKNEASEQFNAWQTVTLLTLSAYGSLSQRILACIQSAADAIDLYELQFSVLGSFLALVKALVLFTERKVTALKLTQVTEFFETLATALQGVQPALLAACSASTGSGAEASQLVRLRVTCVNALLKTVRSTNAIVLNKVTILLVHFIRATPRPDRFTFVSLICHARRRGTLTERTPRETAVARAGADTTQMTSLWNTPCRAPSTARTWKTTIWPIWMRPCTPGRRTFCPTRMTSCRPC